jgi:hypothetical protein
MDATRLRNFFQNKMEDRRNVGRPRMKWLRDAEHDLRVHKMKRWTQKANNIERYVSII